MANYSSIKYDYYNEKTILYNNTLLLEESNRHNQFNLKSTSYDNVFIIILKPR